MSSKKYVEFPGEFLGKTLNARVASVTHQYKFAEICLEIFLPEDSGTYMCTKRLWYTPPYSKENDFTKQNAAAVNQWRKILEIPDEVTDRNMVENIGSLVMLDSVEYSLEIVMETGDSGRTYPKVLSFSVIQKGIPDDWMSFRKKYRLMLLEINPLKERISYLENELEKRKKSPPPPRRATGKPVETEMPEEETVPAVYPWAEPWGTETVGDYI